MDMEFGEYVEVTNQLTSVDPPTIVYITEKYSNRENSLVDKS